MRLQLLSTLGSAFSILTGSIVASAPANSSSAVQPQLEYLFQATINITQGVSFGSGPGPLGTRASFPIVGGSFAGPEISGEILDLGADWGLVDSRGTFSVNAYYQIRTSDNVNIFARSQGPPQPGNVGDSLLTRIILETGDESYYWVNNAMIVGVTTVGNGFLTVDAWRATLGS